MGTCFYIDGDKRLSLDPRTGVPCDKGEKTRLCGAVMCRTRGGYRRANLGLWSARKSEAQRARITGSRFDVLGASDPERQT